ncbi:MAG: nucleotide exchange factor GrpE [Haliscomenobacter sp.]|nr:nucleotide exchange factor GrpE [Haliscomenobacter sp.]
MKKKILTQKRVKVTEEEQPNMENQRTEQEGQEPFASERIAEKPGIAPEFEKLVKDHEELKDKYLRVYADFENFKKRAIKEKLELLRTAAQDTITTLLPVLDDFERARQNAEKEGSTEKMSEGVLLVYQKLFSTLKSLGLEEMITADQVFDPEVHEAITEIPVPTDERKGKIVDTIQKGYKLGDKIIRYAKVVVGK